MKFLIYLFLPILLFACSKPSPEEQAAQAALSYYNRLVEGYPDGLLAAKAGVESLPEDYHRQLVKAYEQYMDDIQASHGGLHAVSLSDNAPRRDSLMNQTNVFLILAFNDSTQEEIVVPMVEVDGEWMLR